VFKKIILWISGIIAFIAGIFALIKSGIFNRSGVGNDQGTSEDYKRRGSEIERKQSELTERSRELENESARVNREIGAVIDDMRENGSGAERIESILDSSSGSLERLTTASDLLNRTIGEIDKRRENNKDNN
jgi:chromosome segregation ATPase